MLKIIFFREITVLSTSGRILKNIWNFMDVNELDVLFFF